MRFALAIVFALTSSLAFAQVGDLRGGIHEPIAKGSQTPPLKPQILLEYVNDQNQIAPITSPEHWGRRRAEILGSMEQVMGALPTPDRRVPLDVQTVETAESEKYTRQQITFASEPGDRVSAYLLIPKELKARAPAMLCLHQTTPGGKDSPAGLSDRLSLHYAHELAERGFVCIVPDYPSFGDYKYDFKAHAEYVSGTMKAIWNNHRAVEVTSCGFTAFHHYYKGDLKGWASDRYMPLIASKFENNPDKMPFDFHGVLAAIAPRAIYVCAPQRDANFEVKGVREVENEVSKVYSLLKAKDRLVFDYPDEAHDFPDASRMKAYDWLKEQLP